MILARYGLPLPLLAVLDGVELPGLSWPLMTPLTSLLIFVTAGGRRSRRYNRGICEQHQHQTLT